MSTALIARHEWRRLAMQPFAWTLMAVVLALRPAGLFPVKHG